MAVILPTIDFLHTNNPLQASESDSVVSRKLHHSYKHSPPGGRLSLPVSSDFPLPLPFYLLSSCKASSASTSRKLRRHSDSRSADPQKWRNNDLSEDFLGNPNTPKRHSAPAPFRRAVKLSKSKSDRGPTASILRCGVDPDQPEIPDFNAEALYRAAPAHGCYRSGDGPSRPPPRRQGRAGQTQPGPGRFQLGGGGGSAGGDDDGDSSPPVDPQPIDPPPGDGKKYYACWFWLYDPVKYHACADIRKEAHHLKYNHLPQHFPNGMPIELRHRLSYKAVWEFLFRCDNMPPVTDRNEKLLLMAQNYQTGNSASLSRSELSYDGDKTLLLSPHSMVWQSEAGESSSVTAQQFPTQQSPLRETHRAGTPSGHSRRAPSVIAPSQGSNGQANWDSSSSNGSSWVDTGNQYPLRNHNTQASRESLLPSSSEGHRHGQCAMRPDDHGITDLVGMDIEIGNIQQRLANVPFLPMSPRIRVYDNILREAYFWDERHPRVPFDFQRFYLVHIGDRSTGADGLISMRSLEVLQREYWYNLAPRAAIDGFILLQRAHYSAASIYPS